LRRGVCRRYRKGDTVKKPFALAILGWLLLCPVAPASAAAAGDVPPRPLTERGLTNLTALTRLIGYVRFFHPSDQAAGLANADWDALPAPGWRNPGAAWPCRRDKSSRGKAAAPFRAPTWRFG
jgi:hypothetical protein